MLLDLHYALRHLRRAPRFSLLAIVTLTLAIGGTAAFASLLRGLVLRPLDVPHPEQVMALTAIDSHGQQGFISLVAFDELRRTQDVLDDVCGYGTSGSATLATEVNGAIVQRAMEGLAGACGRLLGVQPVLGQLLPDSGASAPAEPLAVISYGFWQREFAGDRAAIGRTLRIHGVPLTIVGVTPPGVPTLGVELTPDFSVPQAILVQMLHAPEAARVYYIFGRLRPGVTPAAAQARLSTLWPRIQQAGLSQQGDGAARYMRDLHEVRVTPTPGGISPLRARYAQPLQLLLGLAAIVLLVACVNVGALLLSRAVAREGELSIHLALGATRARVARQLLAESAVLAAIATVAAVPLAFWITRTLVVMIWYGPVPLTMRLTPDASVLAVMAIGGLACGLITGAPALAFWLTRPAQARRGQAQGQARTVLAGSGWMGKALVVVQLALSLTLLFAAGLFFRNLAQLRAIDPGYRVSGIVWMRLNELPGRPPVGDARGYLHELMAQLSRLPGVSTVALSWLFPTASASRPTLSPVSVTGALPGSEREVSIERPSPEFFALTGVTLLEGRLFTEQDDDSHPPVAILNATLARQLFPDGHVLGRRVHSVSPPRASDAEVVGVVRDASPGDIRIAHLPILFRPIYQEPQYLRVPVLALRAEDPAALPDAIRRIIASFDHHYPFDVNLLQDSIDRSLSTERTMFALSAFVGGLGLLLASLGLYALLAYTLGRRQRELGLRMALGASGAALVRMVMREALLLVGLGLLLGVPTALAIGRLTAALLFGLSPSDPWTLLATSAVLLVATGIALAGPARRVGGIDPAVALRAD